MFITRKARAPLGSKFLRTYRPLVVGSGRQVCLLVGIALLVGVFEAGILTLFARLGLSAVGNEVDGVDIPFVGFVNEWAALSFLGSLIFVRLVLGIVASRLRADTEKRILLALRRRSIGAYARANWVVKNSISSGELVQRALTNPASIAGQTASMIDHIAQLLMMVSMLGVAFYLNATLSAGLLVAVVAITFLFRPLRIWIKRVSRRHLRSEAKLNVAVAEVADLNYEAHGFGVMHEMSVPLLDLANENVGFGYRLHFLKASVVPLYTTVSYAAMSLGLLVLMRSSSSGVSEAGPVLLVVLRSLAYGQGIQQAATGLAGLGPRVDSFQEECEHLENHALSVGTKRLTSIGRIEFVDVSFKYASSDTAAIEEFSGVIEEGSFTGLTGPSGSGKTTLSRILLRMLEPTTGQVRVSGVPLTELDRSDWYRRVGFVPQVAKTFAGTVGDNVRFFRHGISEQDIWRALEFADLREEIEALPEGLQTVLAPSLRSLSGGQTQRLAIARAVVTRPNLMVMDEPTSSLDGESEVLVADAVTRLKGSCTVVIVSHRSRTLQDCDHLLRFR